MKVSNWQANLKNLSGSLKFRKLLKSKRFIQNEDMTLYLIIALVPLAGSLIAGLFGNKIGRAGAHTVTILGVAVSAVLSAYVLWGFIDGSRAKFDENVYLG